MKIKFEFMLMGIAGYILLLLSVVLTRVAWGILFEGWK